MIFKKKNSPHVILNVAKNPVTNFLALVLFAFTACTDYEGIVDDKYEEWLSDAGSVYDASAHTLTDLRDNQTYKTVTIGTQTWMAENLNYDYNKGTAKSYCYSNSTANCDKYGRLYLWSAAMDSAAVFSDAGKGCGDGVECKVTELAEVRGVCPEGWHLPSETEWNTLFTAVGGTSTAGTKLKSTSGWNNSGNGVDSFGFSVLSAGYYNSSGDYFYDVGYYASFWSSSEDDSYGAYRMYFGYDRKYAGVFSYHKRHGVSVRCLRDSNDEGSEASSSSSSSAISYGTLTDARDDQTYKTVAIGTQTWMAENLNYDYNTSSIQSSCGKGECSKY